MLAFKTDEGRRAESRTRKEQLREAGRCINGPLHGFVSRRGTVHGPVVKAGKCARCVAVAAVSR